MLQKLRNVFEGWVAKVIFALLVFVFSFFGIEGYFVARNDTWVAKVGGHEVSQQDFSNALNNYRQQQMNTPGNTMDPSDFEKPEVKRKVLDQLVNRQLLLNANDKLGIKVPDSAVRAQIAQVPQFQVDGKFSPEAYLAMLSASGLTPEQYQEQVRSDLEVRQLPGAVMTTAFATPAEVDDYLRLLTQQRDFRYLELPPPAPQDTTVTDAEIAAYYKSHLSQFMSPEQVSVNYIDLNAADMKPATPIDDATLKARYEKEKSRFVSPEQRLVSHILIKLPPDPTPAQKQAALDKARHVYQLATAPGADFARLAEQYSDDLGSRRQGGDLGWIEKGVTDKAFEAALFSMKKGEISQPVLTPEGYHIIDLRDIRPGQVKSFAEVRDQLLQEAQQDAREAEYRDVGSKLTDLIYQDPTSLKPAAQKLGLTIQTSPLFTRDGTPSGVAANKAVVKAAFSDTVLVQGNTSDPIDLGNDHMVVIHINKHLPAAPKPLAEVSNTIRQDILNERAEALARQRADALFAKLEKGATLDALAGETGQKVEQATAAQRSTPGIDPELLAAVFRMPHPGKGAVSRALVPLADGHYALVELSAVRPGDLSKVPVQEREFLRAQIGQVLGAEEMQGLLEAFRKSAKIQLAPQRL